MYKEIATSLALLMTLTGCDVKVHSLTSIKGACQLLERQNLEKKMCANRDKVCIKHEVDCEATSYSSRVSVHSRKDWRAEADGRFEKPEYEDRINANFDAYKKWGIGDERFFIISDNKDDPTRSSHTFYFYLNVSNMPRLLGATFYSAGTREVKEYEFKYDDSDSFSTEFRGRRELKKKYKYTSKYKK